MLDDAMIVFGKRLLGKVHASGESFVVTQFFHLWWLPIAPLKSMVVLRPRQGGELECWTRPLHGKSVLAGYARGWSIGLLLYAAFWALQVGEPGMVGESPAMRAGLGVALALVLGVAGFALIGHLSPREQRRNAHYALVVGSPVDVAEIPSEWSRLEAFLLDRLEARGAHIGMDYRRNFNVRAQWDTLALDAMMVDRAFLVAALALARIRWAEGERREHWAAQHEAIFDKLEAMTAREEAPEPVTHA